MAKNQTTEKQTSNIDETNVAPTTKTTTSTVINELPNLEETVNSQSPAVMPLQNGEPSLGGGLVEQNEKASETENVNEKAPDQDAALAANSQEAVAPQEETREHTVKGGEMRVAAGVHKGRSINGDGSINMNSMTEREKRAAQQKRDLDKAAAEKAAAVPAQNTEPEKAESAST